MSSLTVESLLNAYALGYFPMADHRLDESFSWYRPERRGVLPLDTFHTPRSLRRIVDRRRFEIRLDTSFREVIDACAETDPKRQETWINDSIIDLFVSAHERGFAHSVESWREGRLVGGLYGLHLGGAFFGESMFSREPNASRVALVHLVERLKRWRFTLLDTQFWNRHLSQFGCVEIDDADYQRRLRQALSLPCRFGEG